MVTTNLNVFINGALRAYIVTIQHKNGVKWMLIFCPSLNKCRQTKATKPIKDISQGFEQKMIEQVIIK